MSDFAAHIAEKTLVEALQLLLARWPTFDDDSAQELRPLLDTAAHSLRQAQGSFEPVTRTAETLRALDQLGSFSPVLAPILRPARQSAPMRGLTMSDPAKHQQAIELLDTLLQQPLPHGRPLLPPPYVERPSQGAVSGFLNAESAAALPKVVEQLDHHWNSLPPSLRMELTALFWETAQRLEDAASVIAQGSVAIWFLEQLAAVIQEIDPPALALVQSQLEEARPLVQPKGPVFRRGDVTQILAQTIADLRRPAASAWEHAADEATASSGDTPDYFESLPPPQAASDDQTVARYGAVEFPGRILQRLAVPLTVRLTGTQATPGIAYTLTPMSLQTGAAHPVTVVVLAPDFVIFDAHWNLAHTGELIVKPDADSDPLTFQLLPKSPGVKALAVDFRQNNRLLGVVNLQATVVSEWAQLGADQPPAQATQAMTMPDRELSPPQLELRIKAADQERKRFEFILHSKLAGYNWQSMGVIQFAAEPAAQMVATFDQLNRLARQSPHGLSNADQQSEIETLGDNLFADAFPQELQKALWKISKDGIRDLIITSDEPWIPWELARLFDPDTREAGDFLCARFRVARWLAGDGMTATLSGRNVAAIVPVSNLPFASAELENLEQLNPDLRKLTDADATRSRIGDLLAASDLTGVVHIACHGKLDTKDPTNSALVLSDGSFRPADLSRRVRYRQRPLIFLNACESGGLAFAISGLGGWAERFVKAGAGAFIGALWEVNDRLAAEFSGAFYKSLLEENRTLGDAFAIARQSVRDLAPDNPTWLAYVLYGEPLLRA